MTRSLLFIQCAANTHSNQWFERTLDDSAIRRIVLPEGFLAIDVILSTLSSVADGLHVSPCHDADKFISVCFMSFGIINQQVWPNVVRAHVDAELPFMATEVILMQCVKAGGNRQDLHEAIREHSMAAGMRVKNEGASNDLLERIANDPLFSAIKDDLACLVDPTRFIGRAPEQVTEFFEEMLDPIFVKFPEADISGARDVDVESLKV